MVSQQGFVEFSRRSMQMRRYTPFFALRSHIRPLSTCTQHWQQNLCQICLRKHISVLSADLLAVLVMVWSLLCTQRIQRSIFPVLRIPYFLPAYLEWGNLWMVPHSYYAISRFESFISIASRFQVDMGSCVNLKDDIFSANHHASSHFFSLRCVHNVYPFSLWGCVSCKLMY